MAQKESMYTEDILKIIGAVHAIFGIILLCHQAASAITSWAYMNYNMFEDTFKPGLCTGFPILLLGIICLYQSRFARPIGHLIIIVLTLIVLALDVFFITFKVRFIIHDPEFLSFLDCSAPRWPKSFILDDKPHCNAQKLNNSFGQSILAFLSADIITCAVGLFLIYRTSYRFPRSRYLPALYSSDVVPVPVPVDVPA